MLNIYHIDELTPERRKELLIRQSAHDSETYRIVEDIIANIEQGGSTAVRRYSKELDQIELKNLFVQEDEIEKAVKSFPEDLGAAFSKAAENIRLFHEKQRENLQNYSYDHEGIHLGCRYLPVESAGIYVPGGKAAYPSSVLMSAIPAQIAGVKSRMLITPPQPDGSIHSAVLFCARLAGISRILKVGGAHGVAAAAFGTSGLPVSVIVGPGNRYVTAAKALLAARGVIKMDLPAGPSEVLIIADKTAKAEYVAADMLSQAEHGEDSPAILLTNSRQLALDVSMEIARGIEERPDRRKMKETSIKDHSFAIIFDNLEDAFDFSNDYAPEHLEICTENPEKDFQKVTSAGSVFLGNYAPVALGDYYSGTNHVLPTGGAARAYSGLGVDIFMKRITYQYPGKAALREALNPIQIMSRVEGLEHEHGHSIAIRFQDK